MADQPSDAILEWIGKGKTYEDVPAIISNELLWRSLGLLRYTHLNLPAAAFLIFVPSSCVREVNEGAILKLTLKFFDEVYVKLLPQRAQIAAAVTRLLFALVHLPPPPSPTSSTADDSAHNTTTTATPEPTASSAAAPDPSNTAPTPNTAPSTTNSSLPPLAQKTFLSAKQAAMDGWSKISSSLNNINFAQAGTKLSKGFSSGVQATRERLGQVAPDEITELPQEYKDLEARVDALRAAHISILKITKVYESETYDYPVQIQESLSELSSSIGYNITNFAASNLKGTNLPVPTTPTSPPVSQHKTLPHALARAAHAAASTVAATPTDGGEDKLGRALGLYASGWEKVAEARLDQDAAIQDNFLHPWQTTLNASIAVAMKARQAVKVSRLELDAAKQSLKSASAAKQEHARLEVENAEDDLVQKTEVAITLMKTVLENPEPIKNLNELVKSQLVYFSAAAEALSTVQGEIEELSVAAEGEYSSQRAGKLVSSVESHSWSVEDKKVSKNSTPRLSIINALAKNNQKKMLRLLLLVSAALVAQAVAQCSYTTLQQATTDYVASRAAGQITALSSATYTENFRTADIRNSVFSRPLRIDHNRSIHDTTACATYTELIITDSAHPYVIGTQIHFTEAGQASRVDSIVTDQGDWLFNATGTLYWAQQENWGTIPEERRDTRATIQAAADAYLDLFNNPSVVVPWGTPCARLEGGAYTGRGLPTDTCNVGVPSGVQLVNRRYVIDETVGAVDVFLNFGGANGIPDSHEFRIQEGKLRYVHTMTVMQ
ncbi:unnamed protein product [Cyclocybe aegerita]|uniref:DUF8021 domain-containing protein n=1 Tax=Cyclocybe aegerita TaxID=1973307 RepID=A0A8S0VUT0_CYCAE|nr:unnamed protein product [Cyclocybe aegerita]